MTKATKYGYIRILWLNLCRLIIRKVVI